MHVVHCKEKVHKNGLGGGGGSLCNWLTVALACDLDFFFSGMARHCVLLAVPSLSNLLHPLGVFICMTITVITPMSTLVAMTMTLITFLGRLTPAPILTTFSRNGSIGMVFLSNCTFVSQLYIMIMHFLLFANFARLLANICIFGAHKRGRSLDTSMLIAQKVRVICM